MSLPTHLCLTLLVTHVAAQNLLRQNRYTKAVARSLPSFVMGQLVSLQINPSLPLPLKVSRIHDILVSLPDETKKRIPLPPQFRYLPTSVRRQLKTLFMDPSQSFLQKQATLDQMWLSLTPEERQLAPNFMDVREKPFWKKGLAVVGGTRYRFVEERQKFYELVEKVCMPVLCCYARRRRGSPTTKSPEQCRRNMFGMMLARLDEFESLTPLMVTPASSDEASSVRHPRIPTIASQSPPPPRRSTNGKTLIVPLNSPRGRAPIAPLLGTPDSKGPSLDNGTSKGCETIMEDDENVPTSSNLDRADADFISIDRTTISYLESRQNRFQQCECGVSKPDDVPKFELPTPSYAPPPPPALFTRSPKLNVRKELPTVAEVNNSTHNSSTKAKKSPSIDSVNSLGSPQDSSFSTGSPLDTSASISDSLYVAGEADTTSEGKGLVYCIDNGLQQRLGMEINGLSPELEYSEIGAEPDSQRKYFLHRIEEESEQNEDNFPTGMVTSRTLDSIKSNFSCSNPVDSLCNIIPRSVSQQFELMNRS